MKTAPISLLEYFATDISLSANSRFDAAMPSEIKEGDFSVEVRLQIITNHKDKHRWQVTLEIKHQAAPETNFPYAFRLVLVGFFGVEEWVKSEDEERTVRIHGASVLFGMAREIARAMTGRGPHRPVMLPTVSFYEPASSQPKQMVLSGAPI
jgi:preprotein translocase subunit SecB